MSEAGDLEREQLAEAIRLVVGTQFGSTKMIQQQLNLSRNRAAELMLTLEENSIVGPAPAPGRARDVLVRSEEIPALIQALTGAPPS